MANTRSAKKQIRVSARKQVRNSVRKDNFRNARKEVKKLVSSKASKEDIAAAVSKFYKQVDKAAKENTIHKNAAGRYKSNLAKHIAA